MMPRVVVLLAALVTACVSSRSPAARQEPAEVQVENRGFADMVIYAVDGGRRIRIGTANGNLTTKLKLPSYVVGIGREVQFLADPIGSNRASVSNRIYVRPGETVTLTIQP